MPGVVMPTMRTPTEERFPLLVEEISDLEEAEYQDELPFARLVDQLRAIAADPERGAKAEALLEFIDGSVSGQKDQYRLEVSNRRMNYRQWVQLDEFPNTAQEYPGRSFRDHSETVRGASQGRSNAMKSLAALALTLALAGPAMAQAPATKWYILDGSEAQCKEAAKIAPIEHRPTFMKMARSFRSWSHL